MADNIKSKIEVVQGDITRMKVDAIVNAANKTLLGGGGVDGAIHRAAGPKLLEECRQIGGCPTGEARMTGGYELPARYVIHTVGPIYKAQPEDARLLQSCYQKSLELAVANGVRSIAFPAISCGVYGYPVGDAAEIAIHTILPFLKENSKLQKICFVLFSEQDLKTYQQYMETVS